MACAVLWGCAVREKVARFLVNTSLASGLAKLGFFFFPAGALILQNSPDVPQRRRRLHCVSATRAAHSKQRDATRSRACARRELGDTFGLPTSLMLRGLKDSGYRRVGEGY
jgi:hypothetical protein